MAEQVLMPKTGVTVTECVLSTWYKKKGERVEKGEPLFAYETDKTSVDEESPVSGTVLKCMFQEGDIVPCLDVVCLIGESGESVTSGGKTEDTEDKPNAPETSAGGAEQVLMPKTGVTVTECVLSTWYKKEGDKVEKGEPLFAYETDKTAVDEAAPVSGTIVKCFYKEGDIVPCLDVVCTIGSGSTSAPVKEEKPSAEQSDAKQVKFGNRPYTASPRARALARKFDMSLDGIVPTGPENRIICKDVELALTNSAKAERPIEKKAAASEQIQEKQPVSAKPEIEYEDVKLSNVRKIIAKRMGESLRDIPQLTLTSCFDISNIKRLRAEFKTCTCNPDLNGISINDMMIYALAHVLPNHPSLNANLLNNDTLRTFKGVHIGIAVDTERGLLVPVLHNAQSYSLIGLSKAVHKLIDDTRAGKITPDKLNGASFTISNLGSMKIGYFTPVINGPQTGILGVGAPEYKRKPGPNGEMMDYPAVDLSLTFDHRALDGAPAAKFLVDMVNFLENFYLMQIQ